MAAPGYFRLWRLYAYSTAHFPEKYLGYILTLGNREFGLLL